VSDVVPESCDSLVRVRQPTRPLARWLLRHRVSGLVGCRTRTRLSHDSGTTSDTVLMP